MSRDTKFGYGFLLAGVALPIVFAAVFGSPLAASTVCGICMAGAVGFLVSGHLHREGSVRRRGIMATIGLFVLYGTLLGLLAGAVSGIVFVALNRNEKPVIAPPPESAELHLKEVPPEKLGVAVPDIFIIHVGTNTWQVSREALKKQVPFDRILRINLGAPMPLQIYFNEDGEMRIDATIFGRDGKMAAVIKNNDFAVLSKAIGWDRNWDASGFEIVDAQKHPFFQIDRLEENALKLGGEFRFPNGFLIVINDQSLAINPTNPIISANPLFAYPSSVNFHVRASAKAAT